MARLRAARAALRALAASSSASEAAAATTTTTLQQESWGAAPLARLEADAREAAALLSALSGDLSAAHRALGEARARLRARRPDLLERWRARTREILAAEGEEDVDEEEEEEEEGVGG